jgi:hypothetical protein
MLQRMILLFSLTWLLGCSSAEPIPVQGTVLLNDKPVGGVFVFFYPDQADPKVSTFGTGNTNDKGEFVIVNKSRTEGLPPGTYRVTCSRFITADGKVLPSDVKASEFGGRQTIAKQFTVLQETPLRAVVGSGNQPIILKVSSP